MPVNAIEENHLKHADALVKLIGAVNSLNENLGILRDVVDDQGKEVQDVRALTQSAILEVGKEVEGLGHLVGSQIEAFNQRLKLATGTSKEADEVLASIIETTRSDTNLALKSVWAMAIALGIVVSLQSFALVTLFVTR